MTEPASNLTGISGSPRIIAVCNFKGGVGKTTTCIALANGFAASGRRVTVADFDALGTATRILAGNSGALAGCYELLSGRGTMAGLVIPSHNDNIGVLPSTPLLHLAEMDRAIRTLTPDELRMRLVAGIPSPEAVVIDCGPGLGIIGVAAIAAADLVIVPVMPDALSIMGLERTLSVVADCAPGTPIQILLNSFHGSSSSALEEEVRRRYSGNIIKMRLQPLAPQAALPILQ
jgi:chromosome partitioning protein